MWKIHMVMRTHIQYVTRKLTYIHMTSFFMYQNKVMPKQRLRQSYIACKQSSVLFQAAPSPRYGSIPGMQVYSSVPSPRYGSIPGMQVYSSVPSPRYGSIPGMQVYSSVPSLSCHVTSWQTLKCSVLLSTHWPNRVSKWWLNFSYAPNMCTRRSIHTHIHTHTYTRTHTCAHTYTYMCTHIHTYTYIHTYMYTHIHTYTHT